MCRAVKNRLNAEMRRVSRSRGLTNKRKAQLSGDIIRRLDAAKRRGYCRECREAYRHHHPEDAYSDSEDGECCVIS